MEKPGVLLVCDDGATCTVIKAILEREFSVDVAADSAAAIERLQTGKYVAIVLDVRTGQHEPYAVLDHLHRDRPELVKRALVLTTSLSRTEMARVRQHKVFGVISKPFEVGLLLAAVKECAGGRGGRNTPILSSGMLLLLLADLLRQLWL